MESEYFIFDGVKSSDMGLYITRIEHTGFIDTPYIGSATIEETSINKKLMPYLYGVNREPIEFTAQFTLMDKNMNPKEWTPQERYRIGKWLIHDTYKEFQTGDDLGKIYYVIATNPANISAMNTKGYIEITFRTNSPFAWSPIYRDSFDLSNNVNTTIIELENKSNIVKYYRPEIEIELVNNETDVQLRNLSNKGKIFKFERLHPNETVSIDNENELIKSNDRTSNPFMKFNREWLELVYGINRIEVSGQCKIKIKSQFPIIQ